MEVSEYNLCGAARAHPVFVKHGWRLVRCDSCTLLRVDPQPAGALGYEKPLTLVATGAVELVVIGALWALSGRLNLLLLGDDDAASLGVDVKRTRVALLICASISVSAAVSLSGLVGFVGLLVPHLARLMLGPDQRLLLPASALGGAAFLTLSDLLARLAFRLFHVEPPVGVVTALLGGPVFLLLMGGSRERAT